VLVLANAPVHAGQPSSGANRLTTLPSGSSTRA
jgi:hypothetical protein